MIRVMFYMLSFIVCVTTLTTFWFLFQAQQLMPSSSAVRNTTTINSSIPPFGYNMVVAILTAARQHPTVVGVVARLAADSSYRDYKLLAWQSYSSAHDEETRRTLEGFGVTVFTQRAVYPELLDEGRIKITWGDPLAQVKWRTNHGNANCVSMYAVIRVCMYVCSIYGCAYCQHSAFSITSKEKHSLTREKVGGI